MIGKSGQKLKFLKPNLQLVLRHQQSIKTESIEKLSNFNSLWIVNDSRGWIKHVQILVGQTSTRYGRPNLWFTNISVGCRKSVSQSSFKRGWLLVINRAKTKLMLCIRDVFYSSPRHRVIDTTPIRQTRKLVFKSLVSSKTDLAFFQANVISHTSSSVLNFRISYREQYFKFKTSSSFIYSFLVYKTYTFTCQ